jgi:PKD repeat protein
MFAQDFTASVVPVGVAWKNVRAQYPTIELYNADESHPSIYGTYLAACVFYSSIFHKAATGASFITTGISTTDATSLQNIASNTVLDSLDNWQQYGNLPFANYSKTSTNKTAVFNNLSKHFTASFWDFGDGQTSNLMNPTHNYFSDGNYTVCLTATNACGKQEKFCNPLSIITTPNALNEIEVENAYFIQNGNLVTFKNLNGAIQFQVISMNGEIVKRGIVKNETTLSLYNLHGVYIIQLMHLSKPIKIVLP